MLLFKYNIKLIKKH